MHVAARAGLAAALVAGSVAFALLAAEAALRTGHWIRGRPWLGDVAFLVRDPELGWRANGDLSVERTLVDASGTAYRARVSTERDGFRRFPDANGRPRVLFLGDSFTHAVEVGDEQAYWAVFARRHLNFAVFAIGAGGYGTLQEALLLERIGPRVRPDIVIWQFCDNDLTNNLFEAERRSAGHNNLMRRPYWEGAIVYRDPAPWPFPLMERAYQATGLRVLKFAQVHGHRLLSALRGQTEDGFAGPGGPALRARAVALTKTILRSSQTGSRTDLSFNVCRSAGADFRAISAASGLYFLGDYGTRIAARRPEREVFAGDGRHLNPHGHAALGDLLAADFAKWLGRHELGVASTAWRTRSHPGHRPGLDLAPCCAVSGDARRAARRERACGPPPARLLPDRGPPGGSRSPERSMVTVRPPDASAISWVIPDCPERADKRASRRGLLLAAMAQPR